MAFHELTHQKARAILRKDNKQDWKLPPQGEEYILSTGAKLGKSADGYYLKGYAFDWRDTTPFVTPTCAHRNCDNPVVKPEGRESVHYCSMRCYLSS